MQQSGFQKVWKILLSLWTLHEFCSNRECKVNNRLGYCLLIFRFETTARGRYVYTVQIKTNYVRIKRNDSDFSPTEKKSENLHSHTFFIRKNSFYRNDSSNGGASEEVLNPKLSLIRAAKPHLTTKKVRSKIVWPRLPLFRESNSFNKFSIFKS